MNSDLQNLAVVCPDSFEALSLENALRGIKSNYSKPDQPLSVAAMTATPDRTPPTERDNSPAHQDDVQDSLREVQALLARQKRVENLVHRQVLARFKIG